MSTTPATPLTGVPDPFSWITDFLGKANVQKVLAGAQVATAGLTGTEGKSLGMHISGMTIGAAYGIAVHYIDYLRAKVGR